MPQGRFENPDDWIEYCNTSYEKKQRKLQQKKRVGHIMRLAATEGSDQSSGQIAGVDDYYDKLDLGSLADFGRWSSVIITILNFAKNKAKFNPLDTKFDQAAFEAYKTQLNSCPFMFLEEHTSRKAHVDSHDFSKGVEAVIDLYSGIADKDINEVKTSIKKIAQLASQTNNQEQKQTCFNQSFVTSTSSEFKAYIVYSYVSMKRHAGKGYDSMSQELLTVRARFLIDKEKCKRYDSNIRGMDKKDVDDWCGSGDGGAAANNQNPNNCPGW